MTSASVPIYWAFSACLE